jgi:hypothetical protein
VLTPERSVGGSHGDLPAHEKLHPLLAQLLLWTGSDDNLDDGFVWISKSDVGDHPEWPGPKRWLVLVRNDH